MRYNLAGAETEDVFLKKTVMLFVICASLALIVPTLSGCGGAVKPAAASSSPSTTASNPTAPETAPSLKSLSKQIVGASAMSEEEIAAAQEALRYATDANTGSLFKALSVNCVEGWARVSVQESGVPADEVVGFGVYMKKGDDGKWDVVETGTGLSTDDIPGAPPELFKD